ncbi:MAG: LL-diaminopimelate aminotransferase [Alphaproteobacteria bacterium]|nr:LL-diaminopimelate aminotransferase [Alphaproteobacteria bacterium]
MTFINENFLKLSETYLFVEIGRRVEAYCKTHPEAAIVRCGIGDVTEPLPDACIKAMHKAVDEMAARETFRGYGPEAGYEFLRHAIAEGDFRQRGIEIADDEIFISDGSKCDCANFLDILGAGNRILMPDPVYPVYADTNIMAGNAISFSQATAENGFVPAPPDAPADLIYLCFPNNPTGAVATKEQLAAWVAYAHRHDAIILFDAAYESFVRTPDLPKSIYEIPDALDCAVEMRSFSKSGGFTGLRCGYCVVPKAVKGRKQSGGEKSLHALWSRRQSTKFNGVAYIVQRAAEALYSDEGRAQVAALTGFYLENARLLADALTRAGRSFVGGVDAPYLWVKGNKGMTSWDMFAHLLEQAGIVATPGSGFGAKGEGYFRLSAFNIRENIEEACRRLAAISLEKL